MAYHVEEDFDVLNLIDIQNYVQDVAEAISAALEVDVEITDENLKVIAGTGEFNKRLGTSLAGKGHIHSYVHRTGNDAIIENPGHHELCRNCIYEKSCYATGELCTPLRRNNLICGVIGLVSRNDEERERLLFNAEANLTFLRRMADLLITKILSEESAMRDKLKHRQLEAAINAFDSGILIVDEYGTITQANRYALEILGLSLDDIVGKILKDVLTGTGLYDALSRGTELKNYRARMRKHPRGIVDAICNSYPVAVDDEALGAVLTFQELSDISRITYDIWERERETTSLSHVIGESPLLYSIKELVKRIAPGNSTVLLRGESGTGKGLMARAIHNLSQRKEGPFTVVNCSAIPDSLLESELFGYEEGAFTGARKKGKLGRFELANKGTLFLDEIGDLPLHLQGKILRAIEDRVIESVGSIESRPIDVRIIAATNRDLDTMVKNGEFREDLFYRLNVVPILMPSLRERKEDIPVLANHFLTVHCKTVGKQVEGFSDNTMNALVDYGWPGNVRELSNCVEYAVNVEHSKIIQESSLPQKIKNKNKPRRQPSQGNILTLEELEYQAIQNAFNYYRDQPKEKEKVADALGIHVTTLYRKLQKYDLPY